MTWKARHYLKYLNVDANRLWWRFSLQILPVLISGGLVFWTAFLLMPSLEGSAIKLIMVAVAILLYGGMLTFRERNGWNLTLLLGFAAALGAAFSQLSSEITASVGFELLGIILLCSLAGGRVGRWKRGRCDDAGVILWLVSWAYLFGWAALLFFRLDLVFHRTWSSIGLVLFTGIAAVWFSNMEGHLRKPASISAAVDLFVIGVNLAIAALILLRVNI